MKSLIGFSLLMVVLCECGSPSNRSQRQIEEPISSKIEIVSIVKKKQGYGMNVTAEVKNISNETLKSVEGKFIVRKNGTAVDSHSDPFSNLSPGSTSIIDAYFDFNPDEVTIDLVFEE